MAEILVQFSDLVMSDEGIEYVARACGTEAPDGLWQGWIEFTPIEGGAVLRSPRETTQPNRIDTEYWATGLTPVYLEGALQRALDAAGQPPSEPEPEAAYEAPAPAFDAPAPDNQSEADRPRAILDPFSVYRKGERILRRQLSALSSWHLVNIIRGHALSEQSQADLSALTHDELTELIVAAVRAEGESSDVR